MLISPDSLETLLRTEDIEGLIAAGAPNDEYSSEAKTIASALGKLSPDQLTLDNVVAVITLAWQKSFNLSDADVAKRLQAFRHIAEGLDGVASSSR